MHAKVDLRPIKLRRSLIYFEDILPAANEREEKNIKLSQTLTQPPLKDDLDDKIEFALTEIDNKTQFKNFSRSNQALHFE